MSDWKLPKTLKDMAEANRRLNAEQFETSVQRFEPEDDRPPENPAMIKKQREEITRLQSEVERLQAENSKLYGWLNEAEQRLGRKNDAPWLLHKQAGAVEVVADKLEGMDLMYPDEFLRSNAQRLRQQADEAERAGGVTNGSV